MIRLLNRAQHVHNGASCKRLASHEILPLAHREQRPSPRGRHSRSLARSLFLTYFTPLMLRYDRTSHSRTSSKLFALSRYQSRSAHLLFLARDRAIAGAGRRNLRANETICGRTHILSAPRRAAPMPAAIIPSLGICRTRIQEVHFRRH